MELFDEFVDILGCFMQATLGLHWLSVREATISLAIYVAADHFRIDMMIVFAKCRLQFTQKPARGLHEDTQAGQLANCRPNSCGIQPLAVRYNRMLWI